MRVTMRTPSEGRFPESDSVNVGPRRYRREIDVLDGFRETVEESCLDEAGCQCGLPKQTFCHAVPPRSRSY